MTGVRARPCPMTENLASCAGLVPVIGVGRAHRVRRNLLEAANAAAKLTAVIAGMAAGADSVDDLDVIRAGGHEEAVRRCVRAVVVGDPAPGAHPRPHPATLWRCLTCWR